jgi:diaminohydroxyphosphoribosylaminopyrimidine deaminase / 5-amino-6-(5-phosphoribosylamino)uracil reductase
MRRALEHARRGLGRTTPNPVVGACVVSDEGVVVGDGAHERAGGPHAEVNALDEAGEAARGATLYCTLEPCAHIGRTGPCTGRIVASGIRRVVAAMEDPFPLVAGRGFAALRAQGIEVVIGVERDAAARLNAPYLTALREGRPFVILKAAVSQDGFIAVAPGQRTPLTGEAALRHAHQMRAQVDAVAVGSGTVLADDPRLTAREVFRERPLARIVFDRRLRTPPSAKLFSTLAAGPVIILASDPAQAARSDERTGALDTVSVRDRAGALERVGALARAGALERVGATVLRLGDGGIRAALEALPAHGIHSVVIEGGAMIHGAAWDAGVVDFVQVYTAPMSIGPTGVRFLEGRPWSSPSLVDRTTTTLGPDVLTEGYVHRPD